MSILLPISLFLNLIFTFREFFAVWDHINGLRLQGKSALEEDYFEMHFAGSLLILNLFALCFILFR